MPTMAFAALAHTSCNPVLPDNNGDGKYEWSDVETILGGNDASYVDVVKKPTHTEKGKVVITCKEDYCKEKTEYTIEALGHNDFVAKDLTLEEYAAGIVARGDYSPMDNQYEANAWVKKQKALNICYVKNAYVCSCGRVEWREGTLPADEKSALVAHDRGDVPACTDATCVKCGVALKGTGHVHNATLTDAEKIEANKIPATCGAKVSYKVKCDTCGKLLAVKADETTDVTGAAHNYGTEVASSVATVLQSNGKYKVQSGYVGVKLGDSATYATKASDAIDANDLANYKFYQYNYVVSEGNCNTGKVVGLKCTVCNKPAGAQETAVPAHDWEKTHHEATCDHAGYNTYLCKVCGVAGNGTNGKPVKEELPTEPKLSHNYKVTKVPASCSNAKEYYVIECTTCDSKKCNHTYDGTTTAGKLELKNDATVDSVNIFNVTPATADPAKTKTLAWTGFDNELKGAKVMEFTFDLTAHPSHKYGAEEIVKAATCTSDEVWGKKCTVCGKVNTAAVYTKPNTKTPHTFVKNEVAATCGTAGYSYEQCSSCDGYKLGNGVSPTLETNCKTVIAPVVKKGTDCSFDKWVVTKNATVFEKGVEALKCSVCGADGDARTVIAKLKYAAPAVKAGKKSATVTVKATAGAVSYKISYKKAGGSYKTIAAKPGKKTIKKLAKGKKYTFKVIAVNAEGVEVASATKTVKVK